MARGRRTAPKLVLAIVDSLRTDMLERAVERGVAPTFATLLERGDLIPDCVSSFPSVTPVCCAEIATGRGPADHWINGMNWYHRAERRYVEYGSSLEATRAFGLIRSLYDVVYNMNLGHLSHEVPTFFERLEDAGLRTACTPFLVYRGRTRHQVGLDGLLRRVAEAATFRHAVWGPTELFYGELYASRRVPCKPTLARPGTRDEYSGCVGAELVDQDLFDFMLFSLPDNDYYSHRDGPEATVDSIALADRSLARMMAAGGGPDAFLDDHDVIVLADHAQTDVDNELLLVEALAERWRVLEPSSEQPERADLAVSPTARAANVYLLQDEAQERRKTHGAVRERLADERGVDLLGWLVDTSGEVLDRPPGAGPAPADGIQAAVRGRRGGELRFRPGRQAADARGRRWDLDGDPACLEAGLSGGLFESPVYPDALDRLWSALTSPNAGDIVISLAPGYECVDWGGTSHVKGGSHGSLHSGDSLVPLLTVGVDRPPRPRDYQWNLRDVSEIVLGHFGLADSGHRGQRT